MSYNTLPSDTTMSLIMLDSRLRYNDTNAIVQKDKKYKLILISIDEPFDDLGLKIKDFDGFKFFLKWIFQPRYRQAQYFCLCGSIGNDDKCFFTIGQKLEFVAPKDGPLFLFINDYDKDFTYNNNKGKATFALEQII